MAPLSSSALTEDKRALRREMAEKRAALSEGERRARSDAAAARLLALPELAASGLSVAGYVPAPGKNEIDPGPALAEVVARAGSVALPRVSAEAPRLRFHRAGGSLAPGAFGLLEPAASSPEVALDALDVVIAPGLAFDAEGRRLGFGGGYYDGAFGLTTPPHRKKRAVLIGLAFDFQIVARCPASDTDVSVDLVVTDARVLRPSEPRS
jgi:5-formyltetrahydrofolate cyclo-ligase